MKYEVNDDGKTATITGYEGAAGGDLIIPETIDGYTVTSIGESAFYKCSGFTGDLVIPSKIDKIEDNAFRGCSSITRVINNSNISVPLDNFKNDASLYWTNEQGTQIHEIANGIATRSDYNK